MQISVTETTSTDSQNPNPNSPKSSTETAATTSNDDGTTTSDEGIGDSGHDESVLDVREKALEFDLLSKSTTSADVESVNGLYLYKNEYSLVPSSVGGYKRLKTLKFFGNEVNFFPSAAELGNLVGIECLQIKVPSVNGLGLSKMKGLKELELSLVPLRPSVLTILTEIAALTRLTKLAVCHFSIRYLPPEIGCLINLEHLDLSFNKIKTLPTEISHLNALISFKISNNKLVELPSELSALQRLKNLDLSNNRLTSLSSLDLELMVNLKTLNLQNNKLHDCQIPSWIYCKLDGNSKNLLNDDSISSSVDMDVYEAFFQEDDTNIMNSFCISCDNAKANPVTGSLSSTNRCAATSKLNRRWRRQHYFQQRARQERLNNSRKSKCDCHTEMAENEDEGGKEQNLDELSSQKVANASDIIDLDSEDDRVALTGESEGENSFTGVKDNKVGSQQCCYSENNLYALESMNKDGEEKCLQGGAAEQDELSSSELPKVICNSKRHFDGDLYNPKPCKTRRSTEDCSSLSSKYNSYSFCSIEDHLSDGFYDPGRDRPFLPLSSYDQILHLDSREIILLDREKDEELDAITLSAQTFISRWKRLLGFSEAKNESGSDNPQIALLLALFVSDHFGGGDRSLFLKKVRKSVSGSYYRKPYVCTCLAGRSGSTFGVSSESANTFDIALPDLCDKSIHSIKIRRSSNIVPLGTLQYGVCRHRALLMKYLCDRMEPPIPCELVRGYLDFSSHAWNIIPVKKGDSVVRMVVDACHPRDVREETDPEYFCRYIPLNRMRIPLSAVGSSIAACTFPSLSKCDEMERVGSSMILLCEIGSRKSAAKVRTFEVCGASEDKVKEFEYKCLGEVRILGELRHSCIVEMYGHRICSKWISSDDGIPDRRVMQYIIFMEYIKGGSLKKYLEKTSETGMKHLPVEMALCIARDVASALLELHSKEIIHRDIKSENILIDVDTAASEVRPVVKLCDFDIAVPLRSSLHTCCISHKGVPPPDVCVGTPRWMAPEVFRTMHEQKAYGLEVDIWSYGCLLYELLTLQIPYSGVPEMHIPELLQEGKRPRLTEELEELGSADKSKEAPSDSDVKRPDSESETLRFLIDLYRRCTESNPSDRPTAAEIYKSLCSR